MQITFWRTFELSHTLMHIHKNTKMLFRCFDIFSIRSKFKDQFRLSWCNQNNVIFFSFICSKLNSKDLKKLSFIHIKKKKILPLPLIFLMAQLTYLCNTGWDCFKASTSSRIFFSACLHFSTFASVFIPGKKL